MDKRSRQAGGPCRTGGRIFETLEEYALADHAGGTEDHDFHEA
jgi:hypothetical protein